MKTLIIGGGWISIALAIKLAEDKVNVTIVEYKPYKIPHIESAVSQYKDIYITNGDATSTAVLDDIEANLADKAVIITGNEAVNSLIAQKLKKVFNVKTVIIVGISDHLKNILLNQGIKVLNISDSVLTTILENFYTADTEQPTQQTIEQPIDDEIQNSVSSDDWDLQDITEITEQDLDYTGNEADNTSNIHSPITEHEDW